MCIGAGRSAEDDYLTSDMFPYVLVAFVHIHYSTLYFGHMYLCIIDRVGRGAVTVEKSKAFGELFVENNLRILQSHFAYKLLSCFNSLIAARDGQGKTQLSLTVVHSIAVRLDFGKVKGLIKILTFHRIKSATHILFNSISYQLYNMP